MSVYGYCLSSFSGNARLGFLSALDNNQATQAELLINHGLQGNDSIVNSNSNLTSNWAQQGVSMEALLAMQLEAAGARPQFDQILASQNYHDVIAASLGWPSQAEQISRFNPYFGLQQAAQRDLLTAAGLSRQHSQIPTTSSLAARENLQDVEVYYRALLPTTGISSQVLRSLPFGGGGGGGGGFEAGNLLLPPVLPSEEPLSNNLSSYAASAPGLASRNSLAWGADSLLSSQDQYLVAALLAEQRATAELFGDDTRLPSSQSFERSSQIGLPGAESTQGAPGTASASLTLEQLQQRSQELRRLLEPRGSPKK